ncbi:MAG: tail fiber domain-containing protein [Hormoscilla sp. GUM202]|nr:tail fiber domain-containing protein [Hormoscilla sp. GUM202]
MKGDFTRSTFDASKHYSSVRLQQGRVLLDADWNEQLDIMAYRETTTNKDIIGLNGVPQTEDGSFLVEFNENEYGYFITLNKGRCYVEGILCENEGEEGTDGQAKKITIAEVPGLMNLDEIVSGNHLLYLEVWQHHITAVEAPELREQALGGPDTTTRTQTCWRLKALNLNGGGENYWRENWQKMLDHEKNKQGKLEFIFTENATLPNDLYRVEVHQGTDVEKATFKWARNNASIAAQVKEINDDTVTLNNKIEFQQEAGKDLWIEITDEERVKAGKPGLFAKVDSVNDEKLTMNKDSWNFYETERQSFEPRNKITTVRIWQTEDRAIEWGDEYIELEKGLEIKFPSGKYKTGDYWLIPTRTQEPAKSSQGEKEPDGIQYYYYPLAIVNYDSGNEWTVVQDCREVFPALTEIARETKDPNGNGRKLSIGNHSYNDVRHGRKFDDIIDQLEIQGGKELTLNAGYWNDGLKGDSVPDPGDQTIGFTICEQEVMRLSKDNLSIVDNKDLIVEGTSHLKGVVSIGTEDFDNNIGIASQEFDDQLEFWGKKIIDGIEEKIQTNSFNDDQDTFKETQIRYIEDSITRGGNEGFTTLREDPEYRAFLWDPEYRALLRNQEYLALLGNQEYLALLRNQEYINLLSNDRYRNLFRNQVYTNLYMKKKNLPRINYIEEIRGGLEDLSLSDNNGENIFNNPGCQTLLKNPEYIALLRNSREYMELLWNSRDYIELIRNSGDYRALLWNPEYIALLRNSGDYIELIRNSGDYRALLWNPEYIALLRNSGEYIALLWNPEYIALLRKEEYIALLRNSGEYIALLRKEEYIALLKKEEYIALLRKEEYIALLRKEEYINLICDSNYQLFLHKYLNCVRRANIKLYVEGNIKTNRGFVQTSSDAKQKQNIQTIKDGLSKLMDLRGVTYQWKDGKEAVPQATHLGLVAQEVEKVFPELVSTDSQGMKSLNYSGLIAPLIEAIKNQQEQILALTNQVQQQQTQIEQLQALDNG